METTNKPEDDTFQRPSNNGSPENLPAYQPGHLLQPSVANTNIKEEANTSGVSETDAIHPRLSGLHSSDSISNLASAVMDQMENGTTSQAKKTKKKETQTKKPGKKSLTEKKKSNVTKAVDKMDSGKMNRKNKKAAAGKPQEEPVRPEKPAEPRVPYLRVEGPLNSPSHVRIVNRIQMDEEQHKSLIQRLRSSSQVADKQTGQRARNMSFFVSTMSENYDAHHRDPSWMCVFCRRHSHTDLLGDLYGPYFLEIDVDVEAGSVDDATATTPVARRNSSSKSHRRHSESGTNGAITPTNGTQTKQWDVWFHEDCLVWAPGVCFVAPKLLGLDTALQETQDKVCDHCTKKGAHIFCRFPGCQQRTHFPCAQDHRWSLQETTFTALCPLHEQSASLN